MILRSDRFSRRMDALCCSATFILTVILSLFLAAPSFAAGVSCESAGLKSPAPKAATVLHYTNTSKDKQNWVWITTTGDFKPFTVLVPGKSIDQHTYAGQYWIVATEAGDCLNVLVAPDAPGTANADQAATSAAPVHPAGAVAAADSKQITNTSTTEGAGQVKPPVAAMDNGARLDAIRKLLAATTPSVTEKPVKAPPPDKTGLPVSSTDDKGHAKTCVTTSSFDNAPFDEATVIDDKFAGVYYPGAFFRGSTIQQDNVVPIFLPRGPGIISLSISDVESGIRYQTDPIPDMSNPDMVNGAIHKLIGRYVAEAKYHPAANFGSSSVQVYSNEQLSAEMHMSIQGVTGGGSASLSIDQSSSSSYVLTKLDQPFYTLFWSRGPDPAATFGKGVKPSDVAAITSRGDPVVYVANVTYGRRFYVLFQSNDASLDLKAAVDANFRAGAAGGSSDYKNSTASISANAFAVGGADLATFQAARAVLSGGVKELSTMWDKLSEGAQFGKGSPASPISYKLNYLSTGATITFTRTAPFEKKVCTTVGYCPVGYDYWDNAGEAKMNISIPEAPVGTQFKFQNMRWNNGSTSVVGIDNYSVKCRLDNDGSAVWDVLGDRAHYRQLINPDGYGPNPQDVTAPGVKLAAHLEASNNKTVKGADNTHYPYFPATHPGQ